MPYVHITPWGYAKIFGRRWGLCTRGLYMKIFIMHFYVQNAVPGLYEENRNGSVCSQKWGLYTRGGGGVIHHRAYTCITVVVVRL